MENRSKYAKFEVKYLNGNIINEANFAATLNRQRDDGLICQHFSFYLFLSRNFQVTITFLAI